MAVLGLDIGSDTIKVVEMAKGRGGFQLLNYGITPTPPEAVAHGDVQDPEMLGEAIKQLLNARRIKTRTVVSSVQGQQSLVVRIIDLPRCDPKELADTMQFEVERHIPFAASEIIMDYAVLQRPDVPNDTPNMEVLFAAVKEESIHLHCEALKQAKLKPRAIDVQPLALSRSLIEFADEGRGRGETVAIVNIGANCTDLSIIRDGVLHFPRTIPIGGRSITQRLSEGLGISEQQAERQKRQFASMQAAAGARPATRPAEEEVEEEATEEPIGLGAILEFDTAEDSDVGFGGSGLDAGAPELSFGGDEERPALHVDEEEGRSPFELPDDLGDSGPVFDFGADSDEDNTRFTLAPDDDDEEAEPFSFDLPEEDDSEETPGPAFDLPSDDTGGDEAPTFDFDTGVSDTDSSLPTESAGRSTDVGTSWDVGDLGSDEGLDFDVGLEGTADVPTEGDEAPTFDVADVAAPSGPAPGLVIEDAERARVREVMEPVVREIAAEVGRSLEYYRSRYEGAVVHRVVLVGGTARIDGLAEFFEAELGLRVDIGDPTAALTVAGKMSAEDLRRDAPLLAVAIGLAMRELG